MDYTPEILKEHLGDAYESDAEYVIETTSSAVARFLDSAYKKVGKVPDSSLNGSGTMVVFKRVTKKGRD